MDKVHEILALRRELDEYNANRRRKTFNNYVNTEAINEILRLRRNMRSDMTSSTRDKDYDEFLRLANMLHSNYNATTTTTSSNTANNPTQQTALPGGTQPAGLPQQFQQLGPGGPTGLQTPSASPSTPTFPPGAGRGSLTSVGAAASRAIRARQLAFANQGSTGTAIISRQPHSSATVNAIRGVNSRLAASHAASTAGVSGTSQQTATTTPGVNNPGGQLLPSFLPHSPSTIPGTPANSGRVLSPWYPGRPATPIARSNTVGVSQNAASGSRSVPPPIRPPTPSTTTGISRTTSTLPSTPPVLKNFKANVAANPGQLGQVVQPNMSNFKDRTKGVGFVGTPPTSTSTGRYKLLMANAKRAIISAITRRKGKVNVVSNVPRWIHQGREWTVNEVPDDVDIDVDMDGYVTRVINSGDIQSIGPPVASGSTVTIPPNPTPKFVPATKPGRGSVTNIVMVRTTANLRPSQIVMWHGTAVFGKDIMNASLHYPKGKVTIFCDAKDHVDKDLIMVDGHILHGTLAQAVMNEIVGWI